MPSRVKVNIKNDWTAGVCTHLMLNPAFGYFFPVPGWSIEVPIRQQWFPGWHIGQNRFAEKPPGHVKHKGKEIALEDHDIGALCLDITPLCIINIWYAVMWPLSSRKFIWNASTVRMNKKATGCAQTFAWPVLPMITCGEPFKLPTLFVLTNGGHTVHVGLTSADFWAGMTFLAISLAIDGLFAFIPGGRHLTRFGFAPKYGLRQFAQSIFSRQASKQLSRRIFARETVKNALGTPVRERVRNEVRRQVVGEYQKRLLYTKDGLRQKGVRDAAKRALGDNAPGWGQQGVAYQDNPQNRDLKIKATPSLGPIRLEPAISEQKGLGLGYPGPTGPSVNTGWPRRVP